MTREAYFLVTLLVVYATLGTGCKRVATVDPAIRASLTEAWTVRPHGVKLSGFMRACEGGEKTACNEAAWLMETSGQVTDRAAAEALLSSHGTCDYERSSFYSCVHEGRVEPARIGCDEGQAPMCQLLAKTLQTHLKRDLPAALDAYKRACTLGDGPSCRSAARMIEYDKTLPREDERLLRERACELGEHTECWMLAQWHARGSHGYTKDHAQYKVLMAESNRLEALAEERWTEVRRAIQQDALNRLKQARNAWATSKEAKGSTYCMSHSTGKKAWVRGTIAGDETNDWQGCRRANGETDCEPGRGPAPAPMEQLFDTCADILQSSPATFEFGFSARSDGALLSCYIHAEGQPELGKSVGTSRVYFGECS